MSWAQRSIEEMVLKIQTWPIATTCQCHLNTAAFLAVWLTSVNGVMCRDRSCDQLTWRNKSLQCPQWNSPRATNTTLTPEQYSRSLANIALEDQWVTEHHVQAHLPVIFYWEALPAAYYWSILSLGQVFSSKLSIHWNELYLSLAAMNC